MEYLQLWILQEPIPLSKLFHMLSTVMNAFSINTFYDIFIRESGSHMMESRDLTRDRSHDRLHKYLGQMDYVISHMTYDVIMTSLLHHSHMIELSRTIQTIM